MAGDLRTIEVLGDATEPEYGRCKSCLADIIWFRTAKNEKAIPIDTVPAYRVLSTTRNFGRTTSRIEAVTHFASCPQASEHRRREARA